MKINYNIMQISQVSSSNSNILFLYLHIFVSNFYHSPELFLKYLGYNIFIDNEIVDFMKIFIVFYKHTMGEY